LSDIQGSIHLIYERGTSMTKSNRVSMIRLLVFAVLVLAATSWAQTRPPILEQVAKTYGLDSWNQVEAIRYTWNGEITGLFKASHAQADDVKKQTDAGFTNDNYWLLFPLHAYWDTSATVTDQGMKKLPTGAGSATLVSVKYPAELGGYTPGDTWDLYVGKDNRVQLLVFHHGGDKKPSLVTATWTGYKKAGPLLISTEHRGTADGKPLHISISDVSVKVTGSDTWMKAQ
jgi:hypothetical protein